MAGLTDLLDVLYQLLPPWAVMALVVLLGLMLAPLWWKWVRNKPLKNHVRRIASTSDPEKKARRLEETMAFAANDTTRLKLLARYADEMGVPTLRRAVNETLQTQTTEPPLVVGKTSSLADEKVHVPYLHPIEICVRIEGLLGQGLIQTAEELLKEGQTRHPGDPDLQRAAEQIKAQKGNSPHEPNHQNTGPATLHRQPIGTHRHDEQ